MPGPVGIAVQSMDFFLQGSEPLEWEGPAGEAAPLRSGDFVPALSKPLSAAEKKAWGAKADKAIVDAGLKAQSVDSGLPVVFDALHGIGRDAGAQVFAAKFLAQRFNHLRRLARQIELALPQRYCLSTWRHGGLRTDSGCRRPRIATV